MKPHIGSEVNLLSSYFPVQWSDVKYIWNNSYLYCGCRWKYELFHIYFTSLHCTGKYELNKLTSLPMCGFIAQLVQHRTGIAEVTGSNPVEALIFYFFRLLLSNCLTWKIYCDDHTSLHVLITYKSARNHQPKSRVHVCKISQITMILGQYYFNWNLRSLSVCSCSCADSRVPALNLY